MLLRAKNIHTSDKKETSNSDLTEMTESYLLSQLETVRSTDTIYTLEIGK